MRYSRTFRGTDSGGVSRDVETMRESSVDLIVNDRRIASVMATPVDLEELCVGYVVAEGLVGSMEQVKSVDADGGRVYAEVEGAERLELWHELRSSGCVGIGWDGSPAEVESEEVFSREAVTGGVPHLRSRLYERTRGAHSAVLVDSGSEAVHETVDVSRHNAFDKVLGRALLAGTDTSRHFLLSTGRQSAGMVMKAARCGVPLVATKTAPIASGVEAARESEVGLLCFASETGFTALANPWRVGLEGP